MPATAPLPRIALPPRGTATPGDAAAEATATDTSPTPRTLPHTPWPAGQSEAVHRILPGVVQLRLLSLDEQGFARAENVRHAGEYFLLNEDTEGFQPARLPIGHRFEAQVTAAHYVTRVLSF